MDLADRTDVDAGLSPHGQRLQERAMTTTGQLSPLVLPGVPAQRRFRTLVVLFALTAAASVFAEALFATDTVWVKEGEIAGGVVDSERAEDQSGNDCEDYINIPGGLGPGWARVGGIRIRMRESFRSPARCWIRTPTSHSKIAMKSRRVARPTPSSITPTTR